MTEKIYTLEELRFIIRPMVEKYCAEDAILFGSYARGEATLNSDIDVVIMGGEKFDKTDVFAIAEELYQKTGKNVDVYEDSEINENNPLRNNIEKEGISIC